VNKRLTWEEYFTILAIVSAARSPDPFRKVGAVCVSKNNRVLSTGYNGLPSGQDAPLGLYNDRENPLRFQLTIHAEKNALDLCEKGKVDTLITSCSPCFKCANLISEYGVRRVIYFDEYHRDVNFKQIFKKQGILYEQVTPPEIFRKEFMDFLSAPII
jgi:dCMP deaminase